MAYVTAGTLMLSPSFGRMTAEQTHDLSRIYPFHAARQSARPVDAFASPYPRVYDYRVDATWHQLTFYNTDASREQVIGVRLAGDTAEGALGLGAGHDYYVYDFWNDRLVGRVAGGQRLEQTLRPGEARMMAVHEAAGHPQFLATDRHLMQGFVDLLGCEWDASRRELHGVSAVVGGEPYRLILATNGYRPTSATVDESVAQGAAHSRLGPGGPKQAATIRVPDTRPGLAELKLERSDNGPVAWSVRFESP